jgi:hypothetical protein
MAVFDVSQPWMILLPPDVPAARACGDELSRAIELLRRRAGLSLPPPPREDARGAAPGEGTPLVLLNAEPGGEGRNGFSWRLGEGRLEVHGASGRGLCNGVFDFLAALGFRWPRPGEEEAPAGPPAGPPSPEAGNPGAARYVPAKDRAHRPSDRGAAGRRRLLFLEAPLGRDPEALAAWAARNGIDALVFPLEDRLPWEKRVFGGYRRFREALRSGAERYAIALESGGWDLSLLLPRRYFWRNRELFRMEGGRRDRRYNFCATNHETIGVIQKEAERIFREHPEAEVFHLWPDRGHEQQWCACPSCRAFSPAEQNRMAVNAAADVLAKINPRALISYYENSEEQIDIAPRINIFSLSRLPRQMPGQTPGQPEAEGFLVYGSS